MQDITQRMSEPSLLSLPKYDNPPVVETVLGIQFELLAKLSNAHLGAFWATLPREEWPSVSDAPTLEPQFERFNESEKWGNAGFRIKLSQDSASRVQIKNASGTRMIQVQNGRLHFNWIGEGGETYPEYETVRDGFIQVFDQFQAFLTRENLGTISPNQWELTYVNHIPRNTVWREPAEWTFFRPINDCHNIGHLNRLESFSGEWHYVILENAGRLHIHWQHGVKSSEKAKKKSDKVDKSVEFIRLTLTARGPLEVRAPNQTGILLDGLNLGHNTIVQAFEELMSDKAKKYWGLKHVDS